MAPKKSIGLHKELSAIGFKHMCEDRILIENQHQFADVSGEVPIDLIPHTIIFKWLFMQYSSFIYFLLILNAFNDQYG
jgi:hypothetical protein